MGAPHDVQQVPAPAVLLPFAAVGVDQVAPEQVARHLVVEAQGVVAHADGGRPRQVALDGGGEGVLGQAVLGAVLRQDAGEQAALGVRQAVQRRPAVQHHRLADLVQFGVGAQAGELRRRVAARVGAERLVVVPEEAEARSAGAVGVHRLTILQARRAAPGRGSSAQTHPLCRTMGPEPPRRKDAPLCRHDGSAR
jgi:hypothetical protein